MSAEEYCQNMEAEVDRLDFLFNDPSSITGASRSSPLLESPGLAIVASRSHALRRELLARITAGTFLNCVTGSPSPERLTVIPNQSAQVFMRELFSTASGVAFEALDQGSLEAEEWRLLSAGVNLLGLSEKQLQADTSWLRWVNQSVTLDGLLAAISESPNGSTVVVENYHQVQGISNHAEAISRLRNAAVDSGVCLYVGGGLTHWHEIRSTAKVFLSDLAESLLEAAHIADRITILAPDRAGAPAVVFDPRYDKPWAGELSLKAESAATD